MSDAVPPSALSEVQLRFLCHDDIENVKLLCGDWFPIELLEAGDITPQEVQLFQQGALAFLVRAVEYGINKLPLKEALLRHTRFVDVQQRTECGVEDALYFIDRFQELLPFHGPEEQDKVCEEFLEYQLMDIPMPQDHL
ncbi:hypothetical protein JOQ06_015368 [Pogonophryne albipinna]|uniref:Uncharacterized protein n=1 Tax=Pogonophryne albipinna TaxID=1090488 RepID=A0AAD6ADV1_9TELE|nr:hypothetical protein JOQ06_015368 [Pogonophryne albipinna]